MKIRLTAWILAAGLLSTCGYNTQNSVSGDADRYAPAPADNTRFGRATAVMRKNCASCHVFGSLTEQQYTTTTSDMGDFLVKAGQLDSSALWKRIRGAGAAGDMPPSFSLTADEIETMRAWILGVGKPDAARRAPRGRSPHGHHG